MAAQPDFILDGLEDDLEPRPEKMRIYGVLFFHFAFRTAALVFYIICGWMNNTFVTQSVLLLVLLALDFWYVKNVSGRILAGLRWWSAVDDSGNAYWVFESTKKDTPANPAPQMSFGGLISASGPDKQRFLYARTFWVSLFAYAIVWLVFGIVSIFTLSFGWLLLCVIAVVLNGSNLFGYVRCAISNADSRTVFGPLASAATAMRSAIVRQVATSAITNAFRRGGEATRRKPNEEADYRYAPLQTDGDDPSQSDAAFVDLDRSRSSNVH